LELKHITLFVSTVADISDALPLFFLLFHSATKALKILKVYFLVSFLIKLVTIILVFGFGSPNTLYFYHFLAFFEFCCLLYYFKETIPIRRIIVFLIFVCVGTFNMINSFLFQQATEFNSYSWGLNTFVLMILGFLYLYTLYSNIEDVDIERHSGFVVNTGLLIYFAGSLFTYLLGWYILSKKPHGFFANGWIIQAVASIIKNCIVAYGIKLSYSDR
jgi:hypothetical protein